MRALAWLCPFLLLCTSAFASEQASLTGEQEIEALKGLQYLLVMHGQKVASHLSCTDEGGGSLSTPGASDSGWSRGMVQCQGRWGVILKRRVGTVESRTKWKIVDSLVLPPLQWEPDPADTEALRFIGSDNCALKGRPNVHFFVLARFGKRDRIDWRTGVENAWRFDLKRGQIMPLPIKGIVCEAYEP
jgi:hypothetical protein